MTTALPRADRRATSVEEAAYNHLLVFNQTVAAWPAELKERLPPFSEMYLDLRGNGERPSAVVVMEKRLRLTGGPVKYLLTGQKGSGKSWALQHLAETLTDTFVVVQVSATDSSGATLAEAEVSDVMLLLCEALAQRVTAWEELAHLDTVVAQWARQFKGLHGLPTPPDNTVHADVEIKAFWARFASRMRSSGEVRQLVRQVGADDLVIVANAMIAVLGRTRPVLVLFDDLDKVHPDFARRLFGEQFNVLGRVASKMVLTFPYSLQFENVLAQSRDVLPNLQVRDSRHATTLRPDAIQRFAELLYRLVHPEADLVNGLAVEDAVSCSGGIIREFGRIMASAFEGAALMGDERVEQRHVAEAIRALRVDLLMATQDGPRRESLMRVRRGRQLETPLDRALVNENLVVQYENETPWLDVHPLLASEVDAWLKSASAAAEAGVVAPTRSGAGRYYLISASALGPSAEREGERPNG